MFVRIVCCGLLLALSQPALRAQTPPGVTVGWYNGDRRMGIPGASNWYTSGIQFARVYDDFTVPDGGWIVAGVFSNETFSNALAVTQAAWDIRSSPALGAVGPTVASGVSAATETYDAALQVYRIEVDGLQVWLPPGSYILNVVPAGTASKQSYVAATFGANAVGNPPGNDGGALYCQGSSMYCTPISSTGSSGTSSDYSQGVLISGSAGITGVPPPAVTASDEWRADVLTLAQQMIALHSLPFPGISVTDFKVAAASLYSQIPSLSDPAIRTGLQTLVASIGDPHTGISWPSPSPFQQLPLSFYWFDDGIYVTSASAPYQNLLGGNLLSVGGKSIGAATNTLTALVAHDNEQWVKSRIPIEDLTNADYLFGTGLIPGTDSAPLQVGFSDGSVVSANVQTYANSAEPQQIQVYQGAPPLYRQNPGWNYWATLLDGGATIYFQYNSCLEDPKQPSSEFFEQLDQMMAQDSVQRIILDMRNNTGGTTSILGPWIDEIQASRFNQPGRLYVIVGRATFSAAMEATDDLHDRTAAIFVGEPTGGKPQFELRKGTFPLPYFSLAASYSNGVERTTDPDSSLTPDIGVGLTFAQYMQGIDPAMNAILSIAPPQPSASCAVSLIPGALNAAAAGENDTVAVQASHSCQWMASGFPSWITSSGTASGTGDGTVTLATAENSGGQRGAIVSIGGAALPVIQQGSTACAFSLSAGGGTYASGGGGDSVTVTAPEGCSWVVANPLTWVTLNGSASGTGSGAVSFTVAANSGATQWGTLYIAGLPFTIAQQGAAETGMSLAGSITQIASGGGWDTSLTLVNLGSSEGEAQLDFLGDDGGTPMLPFTLPQQTSMGTMLRATFGETLDPAATLILDTTGPARQATAEGSAQLLTSGDIDGFAIFTYAPTGQAAVSPIEKRNATKYLLPFDDTGVVSTGLAIANLAESAAVFEVVMRDDSGAQIGTGMIGLPALGHNSFMLTDSTYGFPAAAGVRGTVEFDTPPGGRISVLGLRANAIPNSSGFAVTSLPTLADVAPGGGTMAHFAAGGGWQTTFTLVNTGSAPAAVNLDFFGNGGAQVSLPLSFPQTGATATANSLSNYIPAGGSLIVTAQDSGATTTEGSAVVTTSGTVGGFAVFRYDPTGQEAASPLLADNASSYILAFDDTGSITTGLAIANAADQPATVNVVIRNDAGAQIGVGSIDLAARGHTSFMLPDASQGGWAITQGIRGTVEFQTPLGGRIAPLGLRAATIPGGFTVTSIPLMER